MAGEKSDLLYISLYRELREMIRSGRLTEGSRLQSIRQCAIDRQISKTTVEMAYMQLAADGYVISKPQSGFYVTGMAGKREKRNALKVLEKGEIKPEIKADYTDTTSGLEGFNLELWRRYMKSALRKSERLLSYGDSQGEKDLREVLSDYLIRSRNVVCSPDHMVIGAGFQSLLHILCTILDKDMSVCFHDKSFLKGQAIFTDHGFAMTDHMSDAGICYVTPSHMNAMCDVMSLKERHSFLHETATRNAWIIEDDYDSEFTALRQPAPSLQGLDGGQKVIYMGTFSRMLLPSIRISFMILPDALLERYRKIKDLYNQTVSKVDQIALCQYIRDGHLQSQIRRSRRLFEDKHNRFLAVFKEVLMAQGMEMELHDNGVVVKLGMTSERAGKGMAERLLKEGIRLGLFGDQIWICEHAVREELWQETLLSICRLIKK